jgi:ABC-type multidrug transport system fused ATPase/permease subunit
MSPLLLKWLIDGIIPQKRMGLLLLAVALIFLGHQGRVALTSLGSYLMLSASQKMTLTLRVTLLEHLNTLSADYYEETPVGVVMYPLKEPIEEIAYFGSDLLPAILRMLLTTAFTVAAMCALSPVLTLTVLPLIPAFLVTRQYFRKKLGSDADTAQNDVVSYFDSASGPVKATVTKGLPAPGALATIAAATLSDRHVVHGLEFSRHSSGDVRSYRVWREKRSRGHAEYWKPGCLLRFCDPTF